MAWSLKPTQKWEGPGGQEGLSRGGAVAVTTSPDGWLPHWVAQASMGFLGARPREARLESTAVGPVSAT